MFRVKVFCFTWRSDEPIHKIPESVNSAKHLLLSDTAMSIMTSLGRDWVMGGSCSWYCPPWSSNRSFRPRDTSARLWRSRLTIVQALGDWPPGISASWRSRMSLMLLMTKKRSVFVRIATPVPLKLEKIWQSLTRMSSATCIKGVFTSGKNGRVWLVEKSLTWPILKWRKRFPKISYSNTMPLSWTQSSVSESDQPIRNILPLSHWKKNEFMNFDCVQKNPKWKIKLWFLIFLSQKLWK